MRTDYDLIQSEKSPVVQRLNKQAFGKTARLSGGVDSMYVYCEETVTRQDIKMRYPALVTKLINIARETVWKIMQEYYN